MRSFTFLMPLLACCLSTFAQKSDYTIPEGYETIISKEDYKKLVDISVATISKKYKIENVKAGTVTLKAGQDMQAFNLHNLINKCVALTEKTEWELCIQQHFANLFAGILAEKNIDQRNFNTIKAYLGLRIYPVSFVEQRGGTGNLVAKSDLEGTYTLLMLDLPGAFTPVQKATFEQWKQPIEEVFKAAKANVNKQEMEKMSQKIRVDNSDVEVHFLENETYAASYALDLEHNSPELVGEWGSVVAIPNRGVVDVCKIEKNKPFDFVKLIQALKPVVTQFYEEHEQPVSSDFYWYYKGKFTLIHLTTDEEGHINVISPTGLTALMTAKK